jgi:hypothetical protein
VPGGVVGEIADQLSDLARIAVDADGVQTGGIYRHVRPRSKRRTLGRNDLFHVDCIAVRGPGRLIRTSQVEQVGNEAMHAIDLGAEIRQELVVGTLRIAGGHVDHRSHRCERALQLVRGVGHKASLP